MSEDYIYAVTRVHARETGLLGKNDLERLLACPDEKACLQVLQDKGWGTGEPSPTAEGLLAAEEAKTWDFLREVAKDPAPLAPLLVQDYQSVTLIDLRYVSAQILEQFIDFHGQDVLFLYSPSVYNHSDMLKA